jgi:nucleotidyltransferase substrate binding protein (TIGR01987 family)
VAVQARARYWIGMAGDPTPRWQVRLGNFDNEIGWLAEAVELRASRDLSELEKAGMVQRFEVAWELGWKLMADYLVHQLTPPDTITSAAVIRSAFAAGVIDDGDAWMAASKLRHQLSHTYDRDIRDAALVTITDRYLPLFRAFRDAMSARLE